jgi:hypothetical protein
LISAAGLGETSVLAIGVFVSSAVAAVRTDDPPFSIRRFPLGTGHGPHGRCGAPETRSVPGGERAKNRRTERRTMLRRMDADWFPQDVGVNLDQEGIVVWKPSRRHEFIYGHAVFSQQLDNPPQAERRSLHEGSIQMGRLVL